MYKKILSKKEEVEYAAPKCRIVAFQSEDAIIMASGDDDEEYGTAGSNDSYSSPFKF